MSFNSPNYVFQDASSRQIDETILEGPYAGEHTDPDHESAWRRAYSAKVFKSPVSELRNYKEQYMAECQKLNKKSDFAIVWGLNKLSTFDLRFSAAKTEAEFDAILEEFAFLYFENGALIDKASEYISAKLEAEADYLRTIREATDALASGDLEIYKTAEAQLQHTNPINTQAIRAEIAAHHDD